MKLLTEYLERAVSLETPATYRKLVARRAERYGLPPPSKCARVTASSPFRIDPHLPEFGSASPSIASGDAYYLPGLVTDRKAQAPAIVASGRTTIQDCAWAV